MKRVALFTVVGLVALVAAFIGWYRFEAHARLDEKRAEAAVELPRLFAETDLFMGALAEEPLFAPATGDDAGPLLNARLGVDAPPLVTKACEATLALFVSREAELTRAELESCDTSLLLELGRFGRWSFDAGAREHLPPGPRTQLVVPRLLELQTLAKLHLLKGATSGRRAEAVNEVRHLAHLLFTGEYLVNVMVGIALIRIEHRLATVCGTPNSLEPVRFEAMKKRLFAMLFANNQLLRPARGEAPWRTEPRFFRCVAITELAFMKQLPSLPTEPGCWLENARYELNRPYQQPPEDPFIALSTPAYVGGRLAHALAPGWSTSLEAQLIAAEQLPSTGRWGDAGSQSLELMLAR